MSKKVLFIGGTGTISSACSRRAIQEGWDLSLLVRGHRNHRLPEEAELITGDINNLSEDLLHQIQRRPWDLVVNWVAFEPQHIERDFQIFKDCTQNYIFISSVSVYSKPLQDGPVTESHPTGGTQWPYARNKYLCEERLKELGQQGLSYTIVRPGNVYSEFVIPTSVSGLGMGLIKRMEESQKNIIHDDGQGLWSPTFNEDFAEALVSLLSASGIDGQSFHITAEEKLTWTELHTTMATAFGFPRAQWEYIPTSFLAQVDPELGNALRWDKCFSYDFENSKLKKWVPGFKAKVEFGEGIAKAAKYYRERKGDVFFNKQRVPEVDEYLRAWSEV